MCHKHIPKEYLRREIIKISRPNVFGSYFTVSFSTYGLQAPGAALKPALLHLTSPENLYRITTILRIRYCSIHFCLLCLSILKELNSNLWEQSIRQYVFILLNPLFAFFAECI